MSYDKLVQKAKAEPGLDCPIECIAVAAQDVVNASHARRLSAKMDADIEAASILEDGD